MQAVMFSCPHCNRSIRTSKKVLGRSVACPACKGRIEVPESAAAPPVGDPQEFIRIRSRARAAPLLGFLGLLCVGVGAFGPGWSANKPDRRRSLIERAFDGQRERQTSEALTLGAALVGLTLGVFAVRRSGLVLRTVWDYANGDKGRAKLGYYTGWAAVVANTGMLLFMMSGGFAAGAR